MELWNLHRRVALHILLAIGTTPARLLLGVLVATAAVSMWISNTATAVMMMPIAMALLTQLERNVGRRMGAFGAAVMLAVAYGANIGGIGTKIGTGTNSIFVGFVAEKLNRDITFLEYLLIGAPFVALFLPIAWGVLWWVARVDADIPKQRSEGLEQELAAMGPLRGRELTVALVFATAALLWVLGDPIKRLAAEPFLRASGSKLQGKHVEATVAMAAAFALLLLRTLSWAALKRVPWGTLLLLGGSFAMAEGIEGSGLSRWLTERLSAVSALPLGWQLAITSLATIALSAVASNTATVNVMLAVLPPSMPVLSAAAISASCDFALPAGTPPNAIVFGSGYVRLPTMMKTGAVLDLLAAAVITAYAGLYLARLLGR
jgi:solute carrier family 13 (sodium-dependent dicarboxylate transporter), member 2/3/5